VDSPRERGWTDENGRGVALQAGPALTGREVLCIRIVQFHEGKSEFVCTVLHALPACMTYTVIRPFTVHSFLARFYRNN
jgi:hypothetical protein